MRKEGVERNESDVEEKNTTEYRVDYERNEDDEEEMITIQEPSACT